MESGTAKSRDVNKNNAEIVKISKLMCKNTRSFKGAMSATFINGNLKKCFLETLLKSFSGLLLFSGIISYFTLGALRAFCVENIYLVKCYLPGQMLSTWSNVYRRFEQKKKS